MRQLQLMAFGEPSDVIQLNTLAEPALGPEDVLVSMEAAPLNPGLLARSWHLCAPTAPPILARCRRRWPSDKNGIEGQDRSAG